MLTLTCFIILVISIVIIWNIFKEKRGGSRWIYIEIVYNCFIKFIMGFMKLPSILNYVTDLILIIIIIYYFLRKKSNQCRKTPRFLIMLFFTYVLITFISYILNVYSPLLYLWGFRNNMRFIIFSIMCSTFLNKNDIYKIFNILFVFFLLNIIATTYEFFFSGFFFRTGDIISGLYSEGTIGGGNGSLNLFLCVICVFYITRYLNKEIKLNYLMICVGGSLYMAALSELKVFFVEIVFISLFSVMLSKKSFKLILFLILGILGLIIAINLLYAYFPQFLGFFDIDQLSVSLFSKAEYGGVGSLSRTNASIYIYDNFLVSLPEKLFGIGFGNADYSSFSFLTSNFYKIHSQIAYQWFYAPFILLETGIVGLSVYILILINYAKDSIKLYGDDSDKTLRIVSLILSGIAIFMLFYNQSLKTESSSYLMFFCLSIPYIIKNPNKNISINRKHLIVKFGEHKKKIL